MAGDPGVTDALTGDLERLFAASTARLESIVRAGLARGLDPDRLGTPRQRRGDATLAYRQRQLERAAVLLADLRGRVRVEAPRAVGRAYTAGMVAVEATLGERAAIRATFGGLHLRAVEAFAANMTRSLELATAHVGEHVADVFERAQALEGALREDRPPTAAGRFIGRRVDDPYRQAALNVLGDATIGLDTRRQASAMLARRLIREGLSDGMTGLVDQSGARWQLDRYAEMVARTTTAEAVTAGTLNRLDEGDVDLVTITSHPHKADVCTPFDGKTYSRTGRSDRYPPLVQTPPFHPRCRHRLGPAAEDLDEFERHLEEAVRARAHG